MNPTHKKTLRSLSLELRHVLEGHYSPAGQLQPGDLERRLNEIGIWREREAKPLAELPHLSEEDRAARRVIDAYLAYRAEAGLPRAEAVAEFVRESAYTWANRLLALRCMEARAVIDEVILQKEIYGGRSMVHNRLARRDPAACAGEDDGLFAVLLAEFADRAEELPALFNPAAPAIALRPSVPALKRCLALLSGRESAGSQPPADDEVFAAPDALGWAYQYWNAEEKDRVFEKVRTQRGAKIEGADIIPATQLYTEPYMVKFLVQNSLGATWLGLHPDSRLAEGWDYFVKDADRAPVEPDPQPFTPMDKAPDQLSGDWRIGLWTRPNPALTAWPAIAEYALTFDGYDYCEKVWQIKPLTGEAWQKVETFHRGDAWTGSFEDLRACLFMVQRAVKWAGGSGPTDDLEASGIRLYQAICATWDREWPQRRPAVVRPISTITFLDPACGSGHFLLEAFNLFYQMYQDEGRLTDPAAVCASILNHNLFGIDIDERAVQIAAAALWMRAKETAWDLDPAALTRFHDHLVATNIRLPKNKNHLAAFLRRFPEDAPLRPALETVFEGLQNAPELGSLLQLEEPVEKELRYLQATAEARAAQPAQLDLFAEHALPKQGQLPLGVESYEGWQARTLARLLTHFEAEAEAADLGQAFFSQTAGQGLRLFDLLARRYEVVAANPPYMGSKSMGEEMLDYLSAYYSTGKRDLYAAFIEAGMRLITADGRIGFITQQSWMFLGSFEALRSALHINGGYEVMCHLGPRTFSDLSNTNALGFTMFCWSGTYPTTTKGYFLRLVHDSNKESALKETLGISSMNQNESTRIFRASSAQIQSISGQSLFYWAPSRVLDMFADETVSITNFATAKQGLATGDNNRFLRFSWETANKNMYQRWMPYTKGGPYKRWHGNEWYVVEWEFDGVRLKLFITPSGRLRSRPQNIAYYFKPGITWTAQSSYGFSTRFMTSGQIFGAKGPALFPLGKEPIDVFLGITNTFFFQYLFTGIQPVVDFGEGYLMALPLPLQNKKQVSAKIGLLAQFNLTLKQSTNKLEIVELEFIPDKFFSTDTTVNLKGWLKNILWPLMQQRAVIHAVEGLIGKLTHNLYELSQRDTQIVVSETGTPAGWHPLLPGYDALPPLPDGLPDIPAELIESLHTHPRLTPTPAELAALKANLHTFYQAGPGAKADDLDLDLPDPDDDEADSEVSGAHIPIPTETFLEELSVKLQLHPISVYWLLTEGREQEGWRCPPEEKRLTEDRFTVLALQLLGHRWPTQIEAGEAIPPWADADGIIPLTATGEEAPLLARVRDRLAEGSGSTGETATPDTQFLIANPEREFEEIVGESLEKWLGGSFFKRHISQFKKRPIAWQLASPLPTGKGSRGARGNPAFACLLYYHRLDGDLLPKLRSQYLGPLKVRYETELRTLERLTGPTPDQTARKFQLENWLAELTAFDDALNGVVVGGFASPDKKAAARLRQFAVDDAALSLKGRWLSHLAGIIRADHLRRWQAAALAANLSPAGPDWLAAALDRLDFACTEVGPPPPTVAQLPAQPTAADLAPLLTAPGAEMVQQALDVICRRWLAQVEAQVLAPIQQQIDHVLNTATNEFTAKATAEQLRLDYRAARDRAGQVQTLIMETTGFNLSELTRWLAAQPLYDAVSSLDGRRPPPATVADFIAQESAYAPDINDGVRVNIAPLQAAGLLAAEVLAKKDVAPAIANRAEWRADERRWVREGKLPRPGWWPSE